uniref:alpha/beta fold hydrolase n=1 Tax=Polaribacter sp. TaxID=1920175 RepID=UPI0040471914
MRRLKKTLKILATLFAVLFLVFYALFVYFSQPQSDEQILKGFSESAFQPILTQNNYRGFSYRLLKMQKDIDSLKPTIVFVHGTPGSALDFKEYLSDSLLNTKANLIAYDRIGYNYQDKYRTQASILFERNLLADLLKNLPENNTVLVGYSYGGPVALAITEPLIKLILLAPAAIGKEEVVPWAIHFYQWKLTRWMLPKIWKMASIEKLAHEKDLKKFEKNWVLNKNQILCIQGDEDQIVPYANSLALKSMFPSTQFQLKTLEGAGHGLIWSEFASIKNELLKSID